MAESLMVPVRFRPGLRALAQLPDGEFEKVLGVLRADEILPPPEELAKALAKSVPGLAEHAEMLIASMVSLNTTRNRDLSKTKDVAEGIGKSSSLDLPSDVNRDDFVRRIMVLLEAPGLSLTSKALDLANDYDRVFESARVLTDLRPVFSDDSTEAPTAAVIVDTLKIDYYGPEGESRSFHVALDHRDLLDLQRVVERGLKKSASMQKFIEAAKLPALKEPSDDGG